jgi:phosphatidylserine/phosphatidylglycerophosphate/cardiolipin synthase-like enzyme
MRQLREMLCDLIIIVMPLALFGEALAADACPLVTSITVHFSPLGGCQDEAIAQINHAKATVLVQGYGFTDQPITNALVAAHARGVRVDVILDNSDRSSSKCTAPILKKAGIPVLFDAAHAIAHNKIMIIDGRVVLTGSFNWTVNAEKHNAENLVTIVDKSVAAIYTANWKVHQAHSKL